jgi:acetylornithine/N-succinyldiaminopimelate aminotransferase
MNNKIPSKKIDTAMNMKKHLIPITPRPELYFHKGEGHYLYDQNGKAYLDFMQGWAVNTLGHSPKVIQQALLQQSAQLINPGPAFYNLPMLELANTLCQHSVFDQAFFANSGAEANEGAIKLARKWGQKYKQGAYKIITFEKGFHGRTLATMSATGKDSFAPLFEPKVSGFKKVPFNQLEATESAIDSNTVAIMLELVQGEAGVIPADHHFVKGLQQLCKKHSLLLIIDEVQTGIARTGSLFAYQHYNIQPDIMTLGKGLGGGMPISALLTNQQTSCFDYGDQGGTFNGNPVMCAVAQAVLATVLQPEFIPHINTISSYLKHSLEKLSTDFSLGEVRGKGLLIALDTCSVSANSIVEQAREQGLLLNAPNIQTLRFMPALTITESEIDTAIEQLRQVLTHLKTQRCG